MARSGVIVFLLLLYIILLTSVVFAFTNDINIDYVTDFLGVRYNQTSGINNSNLSSGGGGANMRLFFNVTGGALAYSCGLYANSTFGDTNLSRVLLHGARGFGDSRCTNDSISSNTAIGHQIMCPTSMPAMNISNGTQTSIEFFLSPGAWAIDLRCVPQHEHEFIVNSTGFFDANFTDLDMLANSSGGPGGNTTNVTNIRFGDRIKLNNSNSDASVMVKYLKKLGFAGFGGGFGSDYGFYITNTRNVTENDSSYLSSGLPSYVDSAGTFTFIEPDLQDGIVNFSLQEIPFKGVSLNITHIFAIGNFSQSGDDANVSERMLINISSTAGAAIYYDMPKFDFKSMDNFSSCSGDFMGDRFCDAIVNYSGSAGDHDFFFHTFEDCFNGEDDDGDGAIDIRDSDCFMLPDYDSANIVDAQAPRVVNTKTRAFNNETILFIYTDENANLTFDFYFKDSSCSNQGLNFTIVDNSTFRSGVAGSVYNIFHEIKLDNDTLGYNLSSNTTYYYKVRSNDAFGNSGIGTCNSFSTSDSIFSMADQMKMSFTPPARTGHLIGFNFTFDFGDGARDISAESGILNQSKDATLNFTDPVKGWGITFKGVSLLGNITLDMTGNLSANKPEGGNVHLGMGHTKWLEISQKLVPKTIELTIPIDTATLLKCEDDLTNCQDITSQLTKLGSAPGYSTWDVPVTLGFSVYKSSSRTAAAASTASASSTGGGVSGGGPTIVAKGETTDIGELVSNQRFKLGEGALVNFKFKGEDHSLKVLRMEKVKFRITIEVKSEPVVVELGPDEDRTFDIDGDGKKDIQVVVNSLVGSLADLNLNLLEEPVVEKGVIGGSLGKEPSERVTEDVKEEKRVGGPVAEEGSATWWILLLVLIVLAGAGYWLYNKNK